MPVLSGQDAFDSARMLALRGLGFDAIVERLQDEAGFDPVSARTAAARALQPGDQPAVSLAAELAAIAASLDRGSSA